MVLWTMTPDGELVLVVPARRAYVAAITEDYLLTVSGPSRGGALGQRDRVCSWVRPLSRAGRRGLGRR